jgi:hypothetical protein
LQAAGASHALAQHTPLTQLSSPSQSSSSSHAPLAGTQRVPKPDVSS